MIGIKNQKFGMEVEFTGITRQEAIKALGEHFEVSPTYLGQGYDAWGVVDDVGRTWKVMRDGSIKAEKKVGDRYIRTDDEAYRCEFVTPVLTYEDIPHLQEAIRAIRNAGGKVNSSCGLHIHVDAANHNRQSLKNLIAIMYSKVVSKLECTSILWYRHILRGAETRHPQKRKRTVPCHIRRICTVRVRKHQQEYNMVFP